MWLFTPNTGPRDGWRVFANQTNVYVGIADAGENAQGDGQLVVAAIDHLLAVNGDELTSMRREQLRQETPKGRLLAFPFAHWRRCKRD